MSAIGWEWIFFINVPFGIVSIIMVWLMVPDLPRLARRLDFLSVIVSIITMSSIVFTIQQGPDLGWPIWIWPILVVGLALAVVFVRLQATATKRNTEALVPLDLFTIKTSPWAPYPSPPWDSPLARLHPSHAVSANGHHLSAQQAGLYMVPIALFSRQPIALRWSHERSHQPPGAVDDWV